jgi:hypothetical protein
MSNKVLLKKSSVAAKVPLTTDLDYGELALNYADGKLYFKNSSNAVQSFGSTSYIKVTTNTTAIAGKGYIADTTAGTFTITLPASPATGDSVTIADGASFLTTPLTIGRNGSTISDVADDLSLNIEGVSVTFVYDGNTWEVYTQVGAQGGDGSIITATGTTTFTNKTISGSSNTLTNIANASLTNSSVTVNGTSISLGSSGTVTAAAGTLTGNTLASGVTASSLTSVGTLTSLSTSGSITSTGSATTPTINASANASSYANNATVDFANFSGVIIVNRQDSSGNVALWILGSGSAVKLGDSSGSAVSGTFSHVVGINGYRWTNNTGGTITASFMTIKTRDGA